jgi:large subunit ribosomal protein L22
MAEENKKMENKKEEIKKEETKKESLVKEKVETKEKTLKKTSEKKSEDKKEDLEDKKEADKDKKVEKKKVEKKLPKKDEAIALGKSFHISKKHGMYVCSFIKNKKIDDAIKDLKEVILMKRAVPFKGEIPHRKGKGMMSGRYPVKAAGLFINLLKSLKGNVLVNGMDLDKTRIQMASANWAARPMRSNSREGKRTHVVLKAREILEEKK